MIKRSTGVGPVEVISYICDNCLGKNRPQDEVREMPGAPIMVYYPYGHVNDSIDGATHLCSDKCVIEFAQKLIKKYGNWKSEQELGSKVRTSNEWRASKVKKVTDLPKARRATRKPTKKAKDEGNKRKEI